MHPRTETNQVDPLRSETNQVDPLTYQTESSQVESTESTQLSGIKHTQVAVKFPPTHPNRYYRYHRPQPLNDTIGKFAPSPALLIIITIIIMITMIMIMTTLIIIFTR